MIAEMIAAKVRSFEAEELARAWESVRAAVDQYELDLWEQVRQLLEANPVFVRQQLETGPNYD